MTAPEFLNNAYVVLVEECTRPRSSGGLPIPGMGLEEALEITAPWAEGYREPKIGIQAERRVIPPAVRTSEGQKGQKSEEEMVAQNEIAMAHLMGRMANVTGGFTRK